MALSTMPVAGPMVPPRAEYEGSERGIVQCSACSVMERTLIVDNESVCVCVCVSGRGAFAYVYIHMCVHTDV